MDHTDTPAFFTRERILTAVLALLTLFAVYICYRIIEPFVPAIALALALAVATRRPYSWLRRRVRRNDLAAGLAVALVALMVIVPAVFLTTYIVQNTAQSISELRDAGGWASLRDRLHEQPVVGRAIELVESRFRLEEQIGSIGQAMGAYATSILSGSISLVTQLGITLFVLFFLYRDRSLAQESLRQVLPLSTEETDRLFERVSGTIEATVNGSLTVALVQATLSGVVYLVLGVPGAIVLSVLSFFMALVPLGTVVVWGPVTIWLALTGHIGQAIFLAAWGALVVGTIDNLLYPWLVGGRLRLHTVPTFFSVVGGIALFGPAGLIMGPLAFAIMLALIDVWFQRTKYGQPAETAVSETPESLKSPGGTLEEEPLGRPGKGVHS